MEFRHAAKFESDIIDIVDIQWRARQRDLSAEYNHPVPEITLMRRGMFVKRNGRRGVACDPNTILFINRDEDYRLAQPFNDDCACTALMVKPAVLAELIGEFKPSCRRGARGLFDWEDAPCNAEITGLHYRLLAQLDCQDSDHLDPLAVEELAVTLARCAIGASHRFHNCNGVRRPRRSTVHAHREKTRTVKELLAARFRDRLSLREIAAAVHCAPNHLCWIFKQQTGIPIHRYLNRLRLSAALEQFGETNQPLARLALELGFSHHSHFSTAFRQEFGVQPSALRRQIKRAG